MLLVAGERPFHPKKSTKTERQAARDWMTNLAGKVESVLRTYVRSK
jgi:hypothetical protein